MMMTKVSDRTLKGIAGRFFIAKRRHGIRRLMRQGMVAWAVLIVGCEPPIETTSNDLLDYVRNASVGAEVRRLDADAQAYVDQLFLAFRSWESSTQKVRGLADVEKLWPVESNDWRDEAKRIELKAQLSSFETSKTKAASESDDTEATQSEWLALVRAAASDVPDRYAEASGELSAVIEKELIGDTPRFCSDFAAQCTSLLNAIESHAGAFNPEGEGLSFTDADATEQVRSRWQVLHAMLDHERKVKRGEVAAILKDEPQLRADAVARKKEIRLSGSVDAEGLRQMRELDLLIRYYDKRIKKAESQSRALSKNEKDAA